MNVNPCYLFCLLFALGLLIRIYIIELELKMASLK